MRTIPLLALFASSTALAADHAEAPGTQADPKADIADIYAWHTEDGTIVAVLTFDPLQPPGGDAVYDKDVLYGVHIDNNADFTADIDIWIRFGEDSDGNWGVQVTDLPGASGVIEGAVETTLTDGSTNVWAGLRDDPFFFDATGFFATLDTGSIAFTGADAFAGTNITAIVLEMDTATATGSAHNIGLWATTSRK